ncbi:hypothetical protein H5410_042342 [Solanum commersonii]|uniref:Uncharacterized protein n=1 Tax=Solanum commersonii TaxID=4109 RepID=A0A9J5XXC1_SOLCO|nr:hypothetical protein H5410_042342 [Solanum commersonii]
MKTVPRDLFNMGDQVESNLPQSYENEPSEHLMGPSILKDNGEVLLTRTDVPETIIDVPSEEFVTQQLEVEEEEFEEESADEFEDESENEYEDESENELEDEVEKKSLNEFPYFWTLEADTLNSTKRHCLVLFVKLNYLQGKNESINTKEKGFNPNKAQSPSRTDFDMQYRSSALNWPTNSRLRENNLQMNAMIELRKIMHQYHIKERIRGFHSTITRKSKLLGHKSRIQSPLKGRA